MSAPLEIPVDSAVGRIANRPALLVRVTVDDGTVGLGEVWVNFPSWGLRERYITLMDGMRQLVLGKEFADPRDLWRTLRGPLEKVGRQCGNLGTIYQAMSGIEIATWDIWGKQLGIPVHRLIRTAYGLGEPTWHAPEMSIYASGLGPRRPADLYAPFKALGVQRAKLKMGFGDDVDQANLKAMRQALGERGTLMVDANQGWSEEEAMRWLPRLEENAVLWLEEPIPSTDFEGMARLRALGRVRLAGGENVCGPTDWSRFLQLKAADIVQPDVCKAGGIGEAMAVALQAHALGLTVAPHYLGGAVGLVASLHFALALDACPVLEYDANPNPLREELKYPAMIISDGKISLSQEPGLGVTLRAETLEKYGV